MTGFMPGDKNPKHVLFSFYEGIDLKEIHVPMNRSFRDETVYDATLLNMEKEPDGVNLTGDVLDVIKKHIKKYGTIEQLDFVGHGHKENIGDRGSKYELRTNELLEGIAYIEKETGIKVADRIVFKPCGIFSNLEPSKIEFYSNYAKEHKVEIVGSTSSTTPFSGRFVQFTTEGKTIRDGMDSRYNPLSLLSEDRGWINYHLDHTPKQAEVLITKDLLNEVNEIMKPVASAGTLGEYGIHAYQVSMNRIKMLDELTDKVDVLIDENIKNAVIISSGGMVHSKGNIKLHHLTNAEKSWPIKRMEAFVDDMDITNKDEISTMKSFVKSLNLDYIEQGQQHFSMVVLDDNKRVLLATENGGYEVLDIHYKPPKVSSANAEPGRKK